MLGGPEVADEIDLEDEELVLVLVLVLVMPSSRQIW